jgi:type VI secretion system secreted protein VgrG
MVPDIAELLNAVVRFNQDRRLLRIKTPLESESLLVHRFSGVEAVSQPFDFNIELLSPYANLELKSLIGQPVLLTMRTHVDTDRFFHGYVREFARTGSDGGFAKYEAKVAPWFWYLSHRSNCRIYQDLSVIDIVKKVFEDYGPLASARFDVTPSRYEPMPYCVQYNESDFAFVSRILEEVGIHYRFEHTEEGHTLVCSDNSTLCPAQPHDPNIRFHGDQGVLKEDVMDDWTARRTVAANALSLKTYDFKQPANPLAARVDNSIPRGLLPPLERYEYDGAAGFINSLLGDTRATVRMEEAAWRTKLYEGKGNSRLMQSGCYFQLDDHFEHTEEDPAERQFFAVSVAHDARNNFLDNFSKAENTIYRGAVTCVRRKIPYRPERSAPPRMPGPQTATVVGPPGEELYADKYGRVKVQFHWDREGKSNEASSCYVRVASPWAGEGMGGVSIPRVGQEVVVDFLDGNPDRPIIMGRVYNAANMPPFGLEVSGIRSKTVKGGGFNEMTMNDSAGAELLNMHAQRNMDTTVQNDQNNTINNSKNTTVAVDHTEKVGSNQSVTVGANQDTTVQANRSATVNGNDTRTVQGTSDTVVTGAVSQTYNATQTRAVTSDYNETIGGNWASALTGNYTGSVQGNWADAVTGTAAWMVTGATTETLNGGRTVAVTGADLRSVQGSVEDSNVGERLVAVQGALTQQATGASVYHSDSDMTLNSGSTVIAQVGGSSVKITGGAIEICAGGSTIKVDGGGVTVNGAKINLNC